VWRVAWPVLIAGAGCDQLFKLEHVARHDAALDAAPSACEDRSPFGMSCRDVTLVATSDTYLSAAAPDTPLGTRDAIRISSTEPGLFKFDTSMIATDERIAAMHFSLNPYESVNAKACSTNGVICQLCPAPSIGGWNLHWTTVDWNEAQTTWNHELLMPSQPWVAPGAAGIPDDRSELVALGVSPSDVFEIDIGDEALRAHSPNCYRGENRLALLVTIEGVAYFDARENNDCASNIEMPPTLVVSVCR
jgi:hypothetical protein